MPSTFACSETTVILGHSTDLIAVHSRVDSTSTATRCNSAAIMTLITSAKTNHCKPQRNACATEWVRTASQPALRQKAQPPREVRPIAARAKLFRPTLHDESSQPRNQRIGQQKSAGRAQQLRDPAQTARTKDRQSHRPFRQIKRKRRKAAPAAQHQAHQQYAEVLNRQRNRREWQVES